LLQAIEHEHGRTRLYRNAPRTLDLDLLLYGQEQINTERLIVPHPRMHERAFVLVPLADLAPELELAQGSVKELLSTVQDQEIRRLP
ncbi:MAG: 2-amino-4-hydroxy-6-hydroxymethyldihydropteridine diphosphokinase, partial [Alcaligenes aquatilis]